MKKSRKILAMLMVLVMVFGVFSISVSAAGGYGIMIPTNAIFTKQLKTVTLTGRYDYLNLAIDCYSDNTYFGIGIFKDKNYENLVWEDMVLCDKGSYTYTPYVPVKNIKSGTYYAMTFAAKVNSDGTVDVDPKSGVEFTVKIARSNVITKQVVIMRGVSSTINGPKINWCKTAGCTKYDVYRKKSGAKSWTKIATTTNLMYTDTKLKKSGGEYIYTVRGRNNNNQRTRFKASGLDISYLGAPLITSARINGNDLTLKWENIPGTTFYTVYRKPYNGTKWTNLGKFDGKVTTAVFPVKNETGEYYTYTVRGTRSTEYGNVRSNFYQNKNFRLVTAPVIEKLTVDTDDRICIKIDKVIDECSVSYEVYRKAVGDKKWTLIDYNAAFNDDREYYDSVAKTDGVSYSYAVRARTSARSHFIASSYVGFNEMPALKAAQKTAGGVEITWEPVKSAESYKILAKDGDASSTAPWEEIATVSKDKTSYIHDDVYGARIYTVQTIGAGGVKGSYSTKGIAYANIPEIECAIADPTGEKSIKITWLSIFDMICEGYNVYRMSETSPVWSLIGENIKGNEFTDTDVSYGEGYTYVVVGVMDGVPGKINENLAKYAPMADYSETVDMYNTALNNAKTKAVSVVKVKDGYVNYNDAKFEGSLVSLNPVLSNYFAKSPEEIETVNKIIEKEKLPPVDVNALLAQKNIKAIDLSEDEEYQTLKITSVNVTNPVVGDSGVGSLCNPLKNEDVLKIAEPSEALDVSNITFDYEDVTVVCKIEKSTGNLVNLKIDAPCYVKFDANINNYGTVEAVKIGARNIAEYNIAY